MLMDRTPEPSVEEVIAAIHGHQAIRGWPGSAVGLEQIEGSSSQHLHGQRPIRHPERSFELCASVVASRD